MIIKNANVFLQDKFEKSDISVENGRIAAVGKLDGGDQVDATGLFAVPGFIDIHIHGAVNGDFCDGNVTGLRNIAAFLGSKGVTSVLGTSMAYDEGTLSAAVTAAREVIESEPAPGSAAMRGINMEGPFISKAKKGAQAEQYIVNPDYDMFKRIFDLSGGHIKFVDMAPELDGADSFMEKASKLSAVSIAHTEANYDIASKALHNGATHITHTYNAMPSLLHRDPGVIGAGMDFAEHAELISDGFHVHPAAVRAAFKLFGDRICLISDSMRACGLNNGVYDLGGQEVIVSDGKATLSSGTIAGGCTPLSECVRRAISFGIDPLLAIHCATISPAEAAGIADEVGSLEVGKRADIVLLNPDYTVNSVYIGGKKA